MKKSFKAGLFLTVAVSLALFLAFHPGAVEAKKDEVAIGKCLDAKRAEYIP